MKLVPQSMTRSMGRAMLQTKKNSPHIFFGLGIAGIIGSTVLACRATLKLDKEIDKIKTDIDVAKSMSDAVAVTNGAYSEMDYRKELTRAYAKSGVKIVQLYAPSIVLGTASIAALTGSHVQLTRRNQALTGALTLVTTAFEDYRERVRDELGEEKENDLFRGVTEKQITEEGKKKLVKTQTGKILSPYARLFDKDTSWCWKPHAESNRIFLTVQESYANNQLKARGHVFLNDVYDSLGLERTREGQIVGWLYENGGFVDFGLNNDGANPLEPSIWLDFNVDPGTMYDKI